MLALPDIANAIGNRKTRENSSGIIESGYAVLQSDSSLSSQITKINTLYEIKDDFNLQGQTLTIPDGCVLSFRGGELAME